MMHREMPVPPVRRSGTEMARAWEAELESPDSAADVLTAEDQQPADPSQSAVRTISTTAAELQGAAACHSASKTLKFPRRRQEMRALASPPNSFRGTVSCATW
jgi:hypothetical protein